MTQIKIFIENKFKICGVKNKIKRNDLQPSSGYFNCFALFSAADSGENWKCPGLTHNSKIESISIFFYCIFIHSNKMWILFKETKIDRHAFKYKSSCGTVAIAVDGFFIMLEIFLSIIYHFFAMMSLLNETNFKIFLTWRTLVKHIVKFLAFRPSQKYLLGWFRAHLIMQHFKTN